MDSGDLSEAEVAVDRAVSIMDRAVQKGIMHKNNVARRKSRLTTRFNDMVRGEGD